MAGSDAVRNAPLLIAHTLLFMRGAKTLKQIPLKTVMKERLGEQEEAASVLEETMTPEPIDLDEIFRLPASAREKFSVPDGRYAITVDGGVGEQSVHISPHALMYISYVTAATRLVTDQKKAAQLGAYKVITDTVFKSEVHRLKAVMRELDLNSSQLAEIKAISDLLKEGSDGISTRDAAGVWLTQAINDARLAGNEYTLTLDIVRESFFKVLQDGELKPKNNQTRLRWMRLLDSVAYQMILPKVEADIMGALASGSDLINDAYDEIFREMLALVDDTSAEFFETPYGDKRRINRERLQEIKREYEVLTGRELHFQEILNFHVAKTDTVKHQFLLQAVQRYFAAGAMRQVSLEQLAQLGRSGNGSNETQSQYFELMKVLEYNYGYNAKSAQVAIEMVEQARLHREEDVRTEEE